VEPVPESPAWAAARAWRDESNGHLEARELALAGPFGETEEWVGWFESLPLRSTASAGVHRGTVGPLTAQDAFRKLFTAAQSGGAYGPPHGSAYARLHAWESFGWLAGAAPDAQVSAIAALADRCRWYTFDSNWFYHIAWDLGLIAVRPDGRSVAVLAASDTD
jgi:hypothetical protein